MTPFYSSVQVSHNSVKVNQYEQYQDPESPSIQEG